jgi:nuclear receptor subfamily 1 group I
MLDSTDHQQSKQIKLSKDSIDLICKICGDRAIGFNYDVLSCASCKAFFRRNADQQPVS